jgi:hypothetical protein
MKSRVALLFLGVAFIAAPVFAQGRPDTIPGGGAIQELASELSALTARVAKLEGNIVASDLAGTYSLMAFDTSLKGLRAGPPFVNASINTSVLRGTLTLNADGTGSTSAGTCEGSTLTLSGAMSGFDCSESGDPGVTWTYADGVITITFLGDGDQLPFNVALGGRFLMVAFSPFHPEDPSSDHVLIIATRLK